MGRKSVTTSLLILFFFLIPVGRSASLAQEETFVLAHADVFGKPRRPPVEYPHEIHLDALEEEDCGTCHHVLEESTDELIYAEGEEQDCKTCHGARREKNKTALREAFHGSCTVCHRDTIKKKKHRAGPTTCGGCHKKKR